MGLMPGTLMRRRQVTCWTLLLITRDRGKERPATLRGAGHSAFCCGVPCRMTPRLLQSRAG
jgi:hypothetical protein